MVPGGNLEDYLKTTRRLLSHIPRETRLLAAHRDKATESSGAPVLGYGDLVALEHALKQISAGKLKGKGYFIYSYPVNERIRLIVDM